MGSAMFVEDFKNALEFTPVEGRPNAYLIRPREQRSRPIEPDMTAEDWDKFEKDIADAFE
jgi:hypothetical protein